LVRPKRYYNTEELIDGIPSQVESFFGQLLSIFSKNPSGDSTGAGAQTGSPDSSGSGYTVEYVEGFPSLLGKKYEAVEWKEGKNLFSVGKKGILIDWKTGIKFAISRGGGGNHADIEVQVGPQGNPLHWANEFKKLTPANKFTARPGVLYVEGLETRPFACAFHTAIHAGRDDMPANKNCSDRSRGWGYGSNYDWVKGNGWDGHVCLYLLGAVGHADSNPNSNYNQGFRQNVLLVANSYKG